MNDSTNLKNHRNSIANSWPSFQFSFRGDEILCNKKRHKNQTSANWFAHTRSAWRIHILWPWTLKKEAFLHKNLLAISQSSFSSLWHSVSQSNMHFSWRPNWKKSLTKNLKQKHFILEKYNDYSTFFSKTQFILIW